MAGTVQATLLITVLSLLFIRIVSQRRKNPNGLPLPPGPRGFPLIGNAHQVLGKNIVSVLDGWAEQYGPIVHIRLFGKCVIIINSSKVGQELLESRAQNYSGRPNFIMASKSMQDDMMMPFIHANERFHRVRKLVMRELRPLAVSEHFHPIQEIEIRRLIQCIIHSPEHWSAHLSRAVGSILTTAVYDKPLKDGDETDRAIRNVVKLNNDLVNAIDSGQNYVDFLPFLQYVPKVPYKARAQAYLDLAETTYRGLMEDARRNLQNGMPAKGIAAHLLQSQDDLEADFREQYWALGSLYLAGSDTQSIIGHSMIMALALHPHVLRRAQAEIDAVVGDERCPTFADEAQLPYLHAILYEVLRWRPSGPTAIPHATIESDEYCGYFIPGGSMVIPNIWSMHMDKSIFDNPAEFDPQRYLNNPALPLHTFGFGRRSCPGRRVAEHTLFLMLSSIVWALDIKPKIDSKTGRPYPIDSKRETGFASVGLLRPLPFAVSLTPRCEKRSQLLAQIVQNDDL